MQHVLQILVLDFSADFVDWSGYELFRVVVGIGHGD